MRAFPRAFRPTLLIPLLLACLTSPPALAGGPYYDSNGSNPYAAPVIVYGPTQGYASGTVPHVICDSGCSGGGGSSVVTNAGVFAVQNTAATPAGTALIGKVGIDQTTPGTTNGVQINAAIPAGSNVIGHVIVDTAPSTAVTNAGTFAVQSTISAALPAGTNLLGKVGIDQTTPDSTNLVSSKPSVATFVSGTATQTSTTSTSLITAVAAKSIYVTSWNCGNSGASASTILFQDGSGGTTLAETMNPAGGGSNSPGGGVLFKTTAGNALFFAPGTASTTQFCSAAGFSQ